MKPRSGPKEEIDKWRGNEAVDRHQKGQLDGPLPISTMLHNLTAFTMLHSTVVLYILPMIRSDHQDHIGCFRFSGDLHRKTSSKGPLASFSRVTHAASLFNASALLRLSLGCRFCTKSHHASAPQIMKHNQSGNHHRMGISRSAKAWLSAKFHL